MIACGLCGRKLTFADWRHGEPLLARSDYCGLCGRPVSERAKEAAPRSGYVAMMARREDAEAR